jgi:four helix bundle protein
MTREEMKSRTKAYGKQLLRSGTSVGANYRAVCRAKSNSDFINKLRIVEEECDESLFGMELLADNNLIKPSRLGSLMKEADEIPAIIVSSAKTARTSSGRVNRIS